MVPNRARPAPTALGAVVSGTERQEIPVDLRKVVTGKAEDQALRANDILFVPDSTSKKAAARALEAIIQTATGVVIWRGPRL